VEHSTKVQLFSFHPKRHRAAMKPIYLDNASTPIAPEIAGAMRPFLSQCHCIFKYLLIVQ
jgi:hypothetical protein